MPQPVLALGCTAVTAAGSVWFLPALADLRAGADRPLSRRTAALACLTGWGTLAAVAVALFAAPVWWMPAAVAAAGGSAAAALRLHAVLLHAAEQREAARQWAWLSHGPPQAGGQRRPRAVAVVVAVAPVMLAALFLVMAGHGPHPG